MQFLVVELSVIQGFTELPRIDVVNEKLSVAFFYDDVAKNLKA